ncbi:hypothetical protein LINPERHAP1_LOCUS22133 [Linum perenne]
MWCYPNPMFEISPLTPPGVEAVMARFVRKPKDLDEFQYDDHDVLRHCGLKASRRISHTAATPGKEILWLSKLQIKG